MLNICCYEDSKDDVMLLEYSLRNMEHTLKVLNPEIFTEILPETQPDLFLVDGSLTFVHGTHIINTIGKSIFKDVPTIFLTGAGEEALDYWDDFLTTPPTKFKAHSKPITEEQIRNFLK